MGDMIGRRRRAWIVSSWALLPELCRCAQHDGAATARREVAAPAGELTSPVSRMQALQISPHRSSAPEAGLHAAGRAAGDEGGCRCHIGGTHVPEQDNRLVEPQPTVQPGFSLVAHDWSQHPRPALRPEHER